jgi:hypothetical protein
VPPPPPRGYPVAHYPAADYPSRRGQWEGCVHEQRPTTHERRLTGNQRSLLGLSVLSTYGSGMIVTGDVTQPGVVVLTVSAISDQGSLGGKLAADLTRPPPTPLDNRIIRQAADSYDRAARTPTAGCPAPPQPASHYYRRWRDFPSPTTTATGHPSPATPTRYATPSTWPKSRRHSGCPGCGARRYRRHHPRRRARPQGHPRRRLAVVRGGGRRQGGLGLEAGRFF